MGLGKTMVAKGVIAKMALLRDEEGDDLFKVVYVCSNQEIARRYREEFAQESVLVSAADAAMEVVADSGK